VEIEGKSTKEPDEVVIAWNKEENAFSLAEDILVDPKQPNKQTNKQNKTKQNKKQKKKKKKKKKNRVRKKI
jgi:hypothetical protein